eukprot:950937-Rhodomonas_salina.1
MAARISTERGDKKRKNCKRRIISWTCFAAAKLRFQSEGVKCTRSCAFARSNPQTTSSRLLSVTSELKDCDNLHDCDLLCYPLAFLVGKRECHTTDVTYA